VRQQQLAHGGGRGLAPLQRVGHAGDEQAVLDGIDARRALGVARAHVVQAAVRMHEITGTSQFHLLGAQNRSDFPVTSHHGRNPKNQGCSGSA
jgi:hypothetical protein